MSINPVDTRDNAPTIAIVGGGASGTLLASHLLRAGGARVVLIERGERIGRGVAYGTTLRRPSAERAGSEHDRRCPATPSTSSAMPASRHDPATQPTTFVPRRVYGAYLEHVLRESERLAAPGASLVRWRGEVVDVAPGTGARPLADDASPTARARMPTASCSRSATCRRATRRSRRAAGPPIRPATSRDPWRPGALAAARARHRCCSSAPA